MPELDALLLEIRTEPNYRHGDHGCESACCAAPEPIPTVVDPPREVIVTPGGTDEDMGARSLADGGIGFPLASAWDAFSGRPDCSNDISDFLLDLLQSCIIPAFGSPEMEHVHDRNCRALD